MRRITVGICLLSATIIACSSSSSGSGSSSSSGGSSSSSSSSGSSGNGAGTCTGDVTGCALGTLSDAQRSDVCTLTLTIIDSQTGAKFECNTGPKSGQFITINSKDQCLAQKFPASCTLKVQQLVDCYKAVKADACAAFDDNTGACAPIFAAGQSCGGG